MQQKNITIPKTARYFILGEATEQVEHIWFVCHGYGQLGNDFLQHFHSISNASNLIIAPEGLSRFYWKGFSDKIVASWMTAEDRESDINDYVNYLDAVYEEVVSQFKNKKIKITVLGFSQGTATICRWIANKRSRTDHLILWAGDFPADVSFGKNKTVFDALQTFVVIGDADGFIDEEQVKKQEQVLIENKIPFELIHFKGKHEMHQETLIQLAGRLEL